MANLMCGIGVIAYKRIVRKFENRNAKKIELVD